MSATIDGPKGLPVFGNALQIPKDAPNAYLSELARHYKEGVFQLDLLGRTVLFVSDPDLVAEACDESRFYKPIERALAVVRDFAGDGLFTAREDEPVWGHAHRILMPAFSRRSMKAYFPQMLEICEELIASWERRQGEDLSVADDMTRLTLDVISLTGFDYRFNSFQSSELHPFLQAMGRSLTEAMLRNGRLPLVTSLKRKQEAAYRADIALMQELVDDVIRRRRESGGKGTGDLLGPDAGGRRSQDR
ncbi:cytochrome P450 [Nonomuraea spiralis]|uniref:cytochrome P450 n=1 Tax=Nonomuraea spiralis TaxID=46182 RepID=UPI0037B11EA2